MLDVESTVRRAVREAALGGQVTVAAPFDASELILRDLTARRVIAAYLADNAAGDAAGDPGVAGWWTARRRGSWCLKRSGPPTIILIGADAAQSVSGRMLLEARLCGVRRIVLAGPLGKVLRISDVESDLLLALDRGRVGPEFGESDHGDLFHDMADGVGDWLRLPEEAFIRDRVVMEVGSLAPGGAERLLTDTALGLKRSFGLDVCVACDHLSAPGSDFFRPALEAGGIYTFEISRAATEWESQKVRALRERLSRYRMLGADDLFHAVLHYAVMLRSARPRVLHTWGDSNGMLAGLAAMMVGVPRIVLGGSSLSPEHFHFFQPFMRPAYKILLDARPDAVLVNNSRAGADDYARWLDLPRDRIRVILNGVAFPAEVLEDRRRAARDMFDIGEAETVVGSVLRFTEVKRPGLMIDTAGALLARRPGTKFLFVGDGVLLEDCRKRVAAAGLADDVKLPGLIPDAWSALAAMDAFLLTSRMEGLPNVLVEAGAAGLPIVCTGVGGMAEAFIEEETGFSVEADPIALAERLAQVLADEPTRRHIRARAPAHVRNIFGVDYMLRATVDAYALL